MELLKNTLFITLLFFSLTLTGQGFTLNPDTLELASAQVTEMHEILKRIEAGICSEDDAKKFTLTVGLFEKASNQEIQNLQWDIDAEPYDRKRDGWIEATPETITMVRRGHDDIVLKVKEYERDNVSSLYTFVKGAYLIKKHCDFIFINVEGLDSKAKFRDAHKICDEKDPE